MIITILPSSANFHSIAYNEMKVEKGVATLLEAQRLTITTRNGVRISDTEDNGEFLWAEAGAGSQRHR